MTDGIPVKTIAEALGRSDTFLDFQERLSMAAKVDRPVLIVGERGTGKELAASRLHFLSPRWQNPFVVLNCGAVAESLVPSELFGHDPGAFTGAVAKKAGRFERAHTGTLFLDEIGNMPCSAQEMVLRAVEYGQIERVGGQKTISVDVRVIAATNANLPAMVAKGEFRADLLDRLSFEVLTLPPLRARGDDLMLLARHFSSRMASALGLDQAPEFSDAAVDTLYAHSWPGNIRELKNAVERAVFHSQGEIIDSIVMNPFESAYAPAAPKAETSGQGTKEQDISTRAPAPAMEEPRPLKQAVAELEISLLSKAMDQARHNQTKAAKILGLTYNQFRNLYKKHGIKLESGHSKS